MNNSQLFRRLLIGLTLLWVLLLALTPYLILMVTSVLEKGQTELVTPVFTLRHYWTLFSPTFLSMALDSTLLAAVASLLCLLIGYPFAAILARAPARLQPLLLLLVMIPFWTNTLIRTYALVLLFKANGLLTLLLQYMGLISQPLQLMYTPMAVFAGLVYTLLPFMILPLYAALKSLDVRLLEAGRDLGAKPWQNVVHVMLPLTLPGIIAGCTLVFLPALGMFYIADILGGARTMLLGNFIRDQFLVFRNIPMGAATSMAMTILMGLMLGGYYLARRRLGREGLQ